MWKFQGDQIGAKIGPRAFFEQAGNERALARSVWSGDDEEFLLRHGLSLHFFYASFITPRSPSSSMGVMLSQGTFIFLNQAASDFSSGASITQVILPAVRLQKLR